MKVLVVIGLLIIFCGLYAFYPRQKVIAELPETWWGPDSPDRPDSTIRPFRISFSDKDVEDLKMRLNNTRALPGALEGSGWTYGVDGSFLKTILNYWQNDYKFKEREMYMNRYPQFVTNIQGLDIHYIHARPEKSSVAGKRVLPLLVQHGWPGSIVEFHKILPMLISPRADRDFVFEVIAPSLPGFGFSSSATKPGLGCPQTAVILKNLMLRLGFEKFYTQGGDLGAMTTATLAALYPQHVLGMHSNMCGAMNIKNFLKTTLYSIAPSFFLDEEDHRRMYPLKERLLRLVQESGYLHIQATKPDTVGVGPSDSPAALAAYILEKFSTATNRSNIVKPDGGLFDKLSIDELIDNLMMYWIPNSMTTAMRIYSETFNRRVYSLGLNSLPVTVPSACAQFPYEISHEPANFLRERYTNLIRVTRMPRGGHFAAMEEPELLANDIWSFVAEAERFRRTTKPQRDEANEL